MESRSDIYIQLPTRITGMSGNDEELLEAGLWLGNILVPKLASQIQEKLEKKYKDSALPTLFNATCAGLWATAGLAIAIRRGRVRRRNKQTGEEIHQIYKALQMLPKSLAIGPS